MENIYKYKCYNLIVNKNTMRYLSSGMFNEGVRNTLDRQLTRVGVKSTALLI